MNLLKLLVAGAAVGTIVAAFRDFENGGWLFPRGEVPPVDETEPVLGYDGMDRDTLLLWLRDAELDDETLLRVERYERAHRGREPVLAAVEDLLN